MASIFVKIAILAGLAILTFGVFPGQAAGRNHRNCDLHRRCCDPSFRGAVKNPKPIR